MALIRERAKAHSIYLSKINIGFVLDVAFSPGRKDLRCVKLLYNKVDLLTAIVRSGRLPGVTRTSYPEFESSLSGNICWNIENVQAKWHT